MSIEAHAERISLHIAPGIVAAVVLSLALDLPQILGVTVILSLAYLTARLWPLDRPRTPYPTLVTWARVLITASLTAFGRALPGEQLALFVLIVFILDGVDGNLARATNSSSLVGGRLDMECDALLVMSVCLLLTLRGDAPPWVLTCGLLRYAYVLAVAMFEARGEEPKSQIARFAFGISLTGLGMGFLEVQALSRLGPALATALLLYSFGRSFYWSFAGTDARKSQSNSTSVPSEK
jgi:phosphatidylglycerophosphate synthase